MEHLVKAAIVLQDRYTAKERVRKEATITYDVEGVSLELSIDVSTLADPKPTQCFPFPFQVVSFGAYGERTDPTALYYRMLPKIIITFKSGYIHKKSSL